MLRPGLNDRAARQPLGGTMRKLSIALTAATAVVAGGGNTQAAVVAAPKGILAGANTSALSDG